MVGTRVSSGNAGAAILAAVAFACFATLPWSLDRYDEQRPELAHAAPSWDQPLGRDGLGRSLLWRCLLGGAVSLGVGFAAAGVALLIGVSFGALSGYIGGSWDAGMMRVVDVLYGLPYILLVVLLDLALHPAVARAARAAGMAGHASAFADVVTLFAAIGAVSWLTMARVIRGEALRLRAEPFIEAARACGFGPWRVLGRHMLPNMSGPIVVYATLTVPAAILQESFLSFLGIGVQAPLPSWGNLAAAGLADLGLFSDAPRWWLLAWPCLLLAATLLSLNFLGEALRVTIGSDTRR